MDIEIDHAGIGSRVLIVDDDEATTAFFSQVLREHNYGCDTYSNAPLALAAVRENDYDVVISDCKMPKMDGLELLREIHQLRPGLPVILLTGFGTIRSAVSAMRQGAFDYISKSFEAEDELLAVVGRAVEMSRLQRENRYLRQEVSSRYSPDIFVAESRASLELLAIVKRLAGSRATVLVEGESGTGKELLARLIHFWSDRVGRPFVAVNCKAFAEGVLESELFGHEKGAFTGATARRAGCFERAHGGTLLLDEIGETGPEFQVKLLRILQDREVLRVGGSVACKVDVRIVAATNKVLRDEVREGRFREDLFFRLSVVPIRISPLRERQEDILPIANRILDRHAEESGRTFTFSPEAKRALLAHEWPGNVRELENVIERAVLLTENSVITAEELMLDLMPCGGKAGAAATLQEHLDRAASSYIRTALKNSRGNRVIAARELGVDRTTLYRLSKRLGLTQ